MSTLTLVETRTGRRLLTTALTLALLGVVAGCASGTTSSPVPTETTAAATLEEQMIEAITVGDVDAVSRLLDGGLSPDADLGTGGDVVTPLQRAAMDDQPEIASLLLGAGADPNARTGGITVLMLAATSAGAETVTVLLDGGADPSLQNLRNWGMFAIHYAARNGNLPVLALLADRGSDIDLLDSTWSTPLMYAVQGGQPEAVAYLIERGADLTIIDENHATALDWAVEGGDEEIIALLEDAAAAGS